MKKISFFLSALLSLFLAQVFLSCSGISDSPKDNFPSALSAPSSLYCIKGRILLAEEDSRYAVTGQIPDSFTYTVTASQNYDGDIVSCEGEVSFDSDSNPSYSVTLNGSGDWYITVKAFSGLAGLADSQLILSGTVEYNTSLADSDSAPAVTITSPCEGTGSLALPLSIKTDFYQVAEIALAIDDGEKESLAFENDSALISKSLYSGLHYLHLYFYDSNGYLLYGCREALLVKSGLSTSVWKGKSLHFSDDEGQTSFVLTDDCVKKYLPFLYYVDSENGDDSSLRGPLKTMQEAVNRFIAFNDGERLYKICFSESVVDSSESAYTAENHYAMVNVEPGERPFNLEIISVMGGDASRDMIKGNGSGRVLYVGKNATVTISNGAYIEGGLASGDGCDRGGGAYVADGGCLSMRSLSHASKNQASLSGSDDVYLENGGVLFLQQWNYADKVYLEKGAEIWLGQYEGNADGYTHVTFGEYDLDTTWLKFLYVYNSDDAQYELNGTEISDTDEISGILNRYTISSNQGKAYSFTVEGKIEESGVEVALEELRELFAQYISDGRDSVTIALTDSAPDLSVLNEILTAEDIKVILDLSQCTGLTEIGVSGASNSSTDAFQKCENLLSVRLPDSVEKINSYAFYKCTSLTRIILPDSLSAFEKGAFCYCENLGNVILPSGITEISDYLFWNTGLGGITIPASVTSIGKCAFWQCSALYYVSLESSTNLTSIGINAFTECTNLHDISLPVSLETIGKEAFCGCTAIESIVIPDSVKEIGLRAFAGCENLSSINLKADDGVLWNVYEGIYNADSNSFTESDASSSQISTLSLKSDARLTSTSTADAIKLIRSE